VKVLVVDDEEDIRRVAHLSLTRVGGMEVAVATGGAEALEQARQSSPDVILLDVMMPGMDGPAVLAALKADPATAGIPVVFLTAKAMTSEVDRLQGLGSVAVLTKPFDPVTLPHELREALRAAGL
jgi:CheY-like chemotaxis protein